MPPSIPNGWNIWRNPEPRGCARRPPRDGQVEWFPPVPLPTHQLRTSPVDDHPELGESGPQLPEAPAVPIGTESLDLHRVQGEAGAIGMFRMVSRRGRGRAYAVQPHFAECIDLCGVPKPVAPDHGRASAEALLKFVAARGNRYTPGRVKSGTEQRRGKGLGGMRPEQGCRAVRRRSPVPQRGVRPVLRITRHCPECAATERMKRRESGAGELEG